MKPSCVVVTGIVVLAASATNAEERSPASLPEAVKTFNEKTAAFSQPPLTEDEVIASIRAWNRRAHPVEDHVYKTYQRIADTRILPEGAKLSFVSRIVSKGYEFDVWTIRIDVTTGPRSGYGYSIRSRKLRCRERSDAQLQADLERLRRAAELAAEQGDEKVVGQYDQTIAELTEILKTRKDK